VFAGRMDKTIAKLTLLRQVNSIYWSKYLII